MLLLLGGTLHLDASVVAFVHSADASIIKKLMINLFALDNGILEEMMVFLDNAVPFLPVFGLKPDMVGDSLVDHNNLILLR